MAKAQPPGPDPAMDYAGTVQLKQTVKAIHIDIFGSSLVRTHQSELAGMAGALATASEEIPDGLRSGDKQKLCQAVAGFVIHLGHLYGVESNAAHNAGVIDEGASRQTALRFAYKVMEDGGYQLPGDDEPLFNRNFDIAVQARQATEVEDLLYRHWRGKMAD